MTIGERPFTVCKDCPTMHYDNCETCFGWGVRPTAIPVAVALGVATVPITAHEVMSGNVPADAIPCPTCRSTRYGLPDGVDA